MSRASALYVGVVRHARHRPRRHAFRYRLHLLYLDLDELHAVFRGRWFWSVGRRNLFAWHRADYFGDPAVPLREAVLARVEAELGRRPAGPVRMLSHLRCLGLAFNPVSFYYCFAADGTTLEAVLAEITNTPWGERHAYVVDARVGEDGVAVARFAKRFHVSPFMRMAQDYVWRLDVPGRDLGIRMQNLQDGEPWFDAVLQLERRELGGWALAAAVLRRPFITGLVLLAIYWQALRLKLRGVPFHPHPGRAVHPPA